MSIWGKIQHSVSIFRGVRLVETSSHGGFIVTKTAMQNLPALEKLKDFPAINKFFDGKVYNFEEDCNAALILSILDRDALAQIFNNLTDEKYEDKKNDILFSLIKHNPDFFTYLTGKELQIFESQVLMDQFIDQNENEIYKHTCSQSRQWDIPDDKVLLTFKNIKSGSTQQCLATREQYNVLIKCKYPILSDLSEFEPFTPNQDLPYTKIKQPDPNTYYYCEIERGNNVCKVKAYNYQTNTFKHFTMTEHYRDKFWDYKIQFKDAGHTQLIDDIEPFITQIQS